MECKTYGERMTTYDESAGLVFGLDLLEMGMYSYQVSIDLLPDERIYIRG